MKFFNNVKKIVKREQLVFEKAERASRRLVFDMGILPTIVSLLLLFSTVGASIFFTNNNISKSFSTENSSDVAGQISVTKTLLSPASGTAYVGDTVTYRITYSNTGADDIVSFDLIDSFPSANLQYLSFTGLSVTHKVLVEKDNHAEEIWPAYNLGDNPTLWSRAKSGDNSITYIDFDLSSYSGQTVQMAELNIYLESGDGNGNSLDVYGMTSPWEEGVHFDDIGISNWTEATSTTSWNTPGGDFTSTQLGSIATPTDKNYLSTGLTIDTIQKWIDFPSQNHGVALLSSGNTEDWVEFRSREGDADKVPYLDLQLGKSPDVINSNSIVWNNISGLAAGESGTIDISFVATNPCPTCENKVFAEDALDDIGGTSADSDNASVTILSPPDLISVTHTLMSHAVDTAVVGDTVRYKIAYTNTGTVDLSSIPFSEIFPSANLQFLDVSGFSNATEISTQASKDNWLEEKNDGRNYGDDNDIKIKLKGGDDKRGLMHFDLSSYSGYNVVDAELFTFIEAGSGNGNTIDVYEVTRFWDEGNEDGDNDESNWIEATQPIDWTNEGGDYDPTLLGSIPTNTKDWYSTTLPANTIQNWVDNASENYGLILLSSGNRDKEIKLKSNEGTASKISYLELTLKQEITVNSLSGDNLILNDLGGLAVGDTDSFELTFLAIDDINLATITATINGASDTGGGTIPTINSTTNLTIIYGPEICNDGLDNDGDNLIDCLDVDDCAPVISSITTPASCPNSNDGTIDISITNSSSYSFVWDDIPTEGQWTFESTMNDISGNGNHEQVVTGNPAYNNDALEGGESFEFDGATKIQYSVDNAFMSQDLSVRSISMWVKPDNLTDTMALYEEGDGEAGIGLRLKGGNIEGIVVGGGGFSIFPLSASFPTDGNWHHVGLVYDGDNLLLYVDGVEVGNVSTGLGPLTFANDTQGGLGGFFGWHPFVSQDYNGFAILGLIFSGSDPAEDLYTGLMDNVSNYDVALDANQMAFLASNNPDRVGLSPGDYTITVIGNSGCTNLSTISITEPDIIAIDTLVQDESCFNNSDGKIVAIASGGTPGYTYLWNTGSTIDSIENLSTGTYSLTVTDLNGCRDSIEVVVGSPTELILTIDSISNYNGFSISCFGESDGAIYTTPSGGVPPYTFAWSVGTGASEDTLGLLGGTYEVTLTDASGCSVVADTILTEPTELIGGTDFVRYYGNGLSISCENETDGIAVAFSYDGVPTNPTGVEPYSYEWSNGQTEDTLRNVGAGKYYVTATDANGCTYLDSITFVNPSARTVSITQNTVIQCVGGNEASVTANGTGGSGGDTYAWSNGGTTQSINSLSAGIYTVTIADENNCLAIDSITISDPDSIRITGTVGNPGCIGTDGTISISMTGGTGPYTQIWSSGQTTTSISGLSAGTYTVSVNDNLGCLEVDSFTLNANAVLSADISATDYSGFEISCYGESDGNIDIDITGGTGPYSYSWNSGQTTQDLPNVVVGSYTVTITDTGGGCTITRNITLDQPAELGANIADISSNNFEGFGVSCFGESDGFVFVSAFGGDGSHSYSWSNGGSTSGISNLSPGDYTVTVTDGRSCTWTSSYTITEPTLLELDTAYLSSEDFNGFGVSCNGASDGKIKVTPSGGEGTYNYIWSNGGGDVDSIFNLSPGIYTVTLVDGNSCDTTMTFTITEPDAISISNTVTNINCNGSANGEIDLAVTGGTSNYSYAWSTGASTQDISSLAAGDYTVTVTDENTCQLSETYRITEPDTISATAVISDVECFEGNDGAIAQTVSGGTPPYSFIWSNGATVEDISGLTVGTYTVSITDFYNCPIEIKSYIVAEPTDLTISETHSDVTCYNGSDGNISITPSGGTPIYNYLWSNGATTNNLNSIVAGTYTLTVTDANNCSESISVIVGESTEIIASATIDSVLCNGGNTGSISLSVSGGNPGYSYDWNTSATTSTINGLVASTYTVTITDNSSCSIVNSFTVGEPPVLNTTISKTDPLCFGETTGELTANPTGGTTSYSYEWNTGAITQTINNLGAGTYTVTVTDKNDCSTSLSEVISTPTEMSTTHSSTEPLCNGDSDGNITVTPSGGVSPYTYQWNVAGTSNTLNNISAGNYTVTITDLQNCNLIYNITLTEPTAINIASTTSDNLCFGDNNGSIDLTVTGGTQKYVYDWADMDNEGMWTFEETMDDVSGNNHDPVNFSGNEDYSTDAVGGQYSFDFDGSSKIRYSVDFAGFLESSFQYMTISMWVKPDALTEINTLFERGTSSRGLALRMDGSDVQGVVTLGSSQQRTGSIPFPVDGDWHHLALVYDDGDLILYLDGVAVSTINTPYNTISASTGNGGLGGTQGSDAFGNTGNRYYEGLMDNAFFHDIALTASQVQDLANNDGDRTNLSQGTYNIEIIDGNGCTETANITVNEPTELTLTTNQTNVSCNGGSNGVARIIASGATTPYSYSWGGTETRDSLTGLSIGDYTVTVTDDNGCTNTATVTIIEPSALTASATAQDANCNGESNGQISLTVNGGTPNYSYLWSGGVGTSQNLTGLSANTYTVTITDNNGCTTTASATVEEPIALSNTNEVTDISCNGEVDGSITTNAIGGSNNYNYSWSNGGGNTSTISNLGTGTYTVTVTDTNGCTSTAASSITEPNIVNINSTITDVSCNGGDDGGVIALTVTGGIPGYTYLWSDMDVEAYYGFEQSMNDETGNNHNPMSGGVGIEAYASDNIERDYAFDFDGATKIEYEENNNFLNGTISTFSVSMWIKPDHFTGNQTLFEMGGVSDGFGIRLSGNILQVGVNESFTLYGLQYPFPNDGAWHHVTITFDNGDLTLFFDGVELGIYNSGVGSVVIANSQEGGLGGTFGTDAFGGAGDFFYNGLMDGVGYFNNALTAQQVAEVMTNDGTRSLLSANTYTVTVIDANGCLTTQTLSVTEPTALTITSTKEDIGCNGSSSGSIDITIGGGTPNYSYNWSNSATTQDVTGLDSGDYTVTVTDDNGCTILLTETITEPTSLSVSTQRTINYNGSDISCAGNDDGAVEVIINGGTPNYNISWSSGQTTQEITGLGAGTYVVTVSDNNGCTGTSQISLSAPPSISLSVDRTIDYSNQDISCYGASDGELGTTVSGGSGTYSYSWSNGSTTTTISNLSTGTYTVTVTDGFGCTVTASDVVSEPSELSVSISLTGSGVSCPDATDAGINSSVSGGTTGYTYLWNGGQTTANLSSLGSGVYMLTVTDANNCTAADTLTLTAPSDLNFTTTFSDLTDCGADDGAIGVNASGGTGSYEYSIDGTNWQTDNEFYNLAPGTYNVYVRNSVGTCVKGPKTVVINVPEAPVINNTVLINPSTGVSTDGSIIVNASGNGVQLNYQIEGVTGWQESSVFSNLSEGVYTINVKYYNQTCETSTTVELVAGGGVVGGSQDSDYCSGEINSGQLVEIYYIPFPENQVLQSLYSFNSDTCGFIEKVRNPVQSYVSIGVVEEGTIIYYDHWEDGYEPNLGFPIQSTTEIWGDGDLSNGFAPGYGSNDLFQSSDNIILSESIDTTTATRIATIDYDGSDKIASRGNIAMTRLAWADESETLLAGAIEVYPIPYWGTDYEIPVGEDYLVNEMFEYTGFVVMATENNTSVNIDADANGTVETTVILNEGESYLADGNVNTGGTIQASANVQVHLVTGNICAGFTTRWFTLKPTEQWSNAYYTAVSTINDDTYVHIYNPSASTITIDWETNSGVETSFSVGGGNTVDVSIPDGSGAKFSSSGGEDFYAISTTGAFISLANDWGYALIPEDQLSPQITLVSLAPGIDPTIGCQSISQISQAGWSVHYVDSEETVGESAPASNAFDGDNSTFWHTQWDGSSPVHPHELQIDLGASYNIGGFRYQPRASCTYSTNSYSDTTDVTIDIGAGAVYTSDINVTATGTVTDVNLTILDIKHTWVSDLEVTLTSPLGTIVTLYNNECGDADDIFMGLDDEATTGYGCPPTSGATHRPFGSLSDFFGENINGTWRLTVNDQATGDGGFIDDWTLEIASQECIGGVENGAIADYDFYISSDGINWGSANVSGAFPNSTDQQEVIFSTEIGRYIRIVANSELNGNPWTSIAELNVLECLNSENSAPVWITAAFPTGSTSVGNINVCVDFNGDGGPLTDANGISFDSTFVFSHLDREKILDADGDQTGMRIWVCDGSDAIIAGAWGQDPSTASPGSPAIDLGVGLPNGIPFSTSKCVNLSRDYNLDGDFDECDEVIYTIIVENTGVLPLSVGSLNIIDTLPAGLTYIENTTVSRINGSNDTIPDETSTASVFPLDENGIDYNSIIQPGDSIILFFQASIDELSGNGTIITNQAYVSNFQTQFVPEVTFPVDNPENPFLTGVPSDVTVECDSIPIAPLLDEPNCTFSNIDYPAAQTAGTTAMDGQVISGDGVTSTFNLTEGGITEEFRIADNLYPRNALQNIPCGASTKAIDFQIQQAESNGEWGADSSSVFEIDFSQPVENLSFSLLDLDESLFYVDAVEVRIFDGSNAEIEYDCGYFTINNNVDWLGGNEFQALDNTDGYTPVAGTDDDGDVRFTFYNLLIKRVEITLKNNWTRSSTSTGTNSTTFNDYMTANPDISHGIGIGQICYCIPGTNAGTIFIANDCAGLDTLAYTEVRTDGSCDSEYTLTRTWTGTDHCGNDSTMTQVITVEDNTPPVLSGIPADITATPSTIPNAPPTDCSDGVNLALGKTVTQSSIDYSLPAGNVIDGNLNNFNHTLGSGDPQSWWQIDLGTLEEISVLEIYNRVSCCQSRTSQYYILVSETPFSSNDLSALLADPNVASYYQSTDAGFPTTMNISRVGRYVRVQLTSTSDPMNIAEVMVYGSVSNCITALDGCDSYPTITYTENTVSNTCNYTIERIWTAIDDCGNIQRDTQEIFVEAILSATDTITSDYNGRDISCNGGNDGAAHVIATGGVRPFSYAWSGGISVDSFATGLSAGTYTVTISDDNGCTALRNIILSDPPAIDLNAQTTSGNATYQISCNGASDGTAFAVATNGTGTKTYEWSTGATTQAVSGLVAGTYTVTATDANLCQTTATVNLIQPGPLQVNTSVISEVSCIGAEDGSVLATPSGGVTPYSLLWNTNDTDPILTDLGVGTYTITVTDGNGCTVESSVTLNNPIPISINFSIDNPISCQGGNDGQITASASGGAGGYSYAWDNSASGATVSGLNIGKYIVTVTDGNSCIGIDSITLTNPNALSALISVTSDFNGENISCTGASDGRVKAFASGGTSPYTYLWSDIAGATIDSLSGVPAGVYTVTITDNNTCTTTASLEVFDPTPVIVNAGNNQNICSGYDAEIGAIGAGGTPTYTYEWSTGETTDSITVNSIVDSTFYVTITDANNCTSMDSVSVFIVSCLEICDDGIDNDFDGLIDCDDPDCFSLANAFVSSNYNGEDISCDGASDGEATVRPAGGKSPYTYLWNDPLGQTDTTATGLNAGTYTVTVTDDNGCTATANVTLEDPDNLSLTVLDYSATVSCTGDTDGFVDISVVGGTTLTGTDYTYEWSVGGFTTQDINPPLGAGTYTVTVTDINNCQATTSVTIGEPIVVGSGVTIASAYGSGSEALSCAGGTDGLIVATATGGDGDYEYVWNNGSTNDSLINIGAGTYTVTISDGFGCSSTAAVSLTDPPVLSLSATATASSDCNVSNGTIEITASGSTGDLEYSIDNTNWLTSNTYTNLSSGTYSVYVRNTDQTCFVGPVTVVIDEPDAPIIFSAAAINPQAAGSSDGEILVEAEGPSSPLEYRLVGITPWQTSSYFQGLDAGDYIIEVRNQGENCPAQRPISLISGGSLFGDSGASYCSDDFSNEQISETYYIPIPEDQALSSLEQLYPSSCGASALPASPIRSYVSISVVESDARIYYDHWEDGFENDLGNIIQTSTSVWGDGDLSNGVAPGYPADILAAGDVIILDENVNTGTRSSVVDYDGGDKIATTGNLAITRLAWASGSGTYLAGAVEIYPTVNWGRNFVLPVGEDYLVNEMFDYVGATIMAFENNTSINIDADSDGSAETTITLNEGESYLINGGINVGATVDADKAIQVHLLTGNICASYEGRWITLTPRDQWNDSYYNPVSTQLYSSQPDSSLNDPTYVHIHNPNTNLINVRWETNAGLQPNINVPAGTTVWVEIPVGTGSHFYTNSGAEFYAVATIGSAGETFMHDWGFGLIPQNQLTPQITMVGFAPGQDPTYAGASTSNTAPVWLTGNYPAGSSFSGNITVCVDYNGDGGGLLDINGVPYDVSYSLNPLDQLKINDPDGDQTGMRIWVCDNSDAFVAGAWGQDPLVSTGSGLEEIDLGTGLPNGIPFNTNECVDLTFDHNNDALFDVCDEVSYTISIQNSGALPFPANSILIIDTLAVELDYIDNSTIVYVNGIITPWSDDSAPPAGSTFPLDEGGAYYPNVILPGDSIEIIFTASINAQPTGDGIISNPVIVFDGTKQTETNVDFYVENQTPPALLNVPMDVTVSCDSVPNPPALDTANCTLTTVPYPGIQPSGTTAMNAQNLTTSGVTTTYSVITGGIIEDFNMTDGQYPRSANQNIPCGASTKAISLTQDQEASNSVYGTGDSTVIRIEFSQEVEDLSFGLLDFDEGVWYVDGATVRVYDASNTEINYDCSQLTIGRNITMEGSNHFHALDNSDGYNDLADTDSVGDVRFNFYDIPVRRIDIILKNDWNSGSTSSGTSATSFADYFAANPNEDHGIAISEMCFCVPGTIAEEGTIIPADDCRDEVTITYSETTAIISCANNYTITRTWTATDDCGQSTVYTQQITVEDNVAPTISGVPADVTVTPTTIPTIPAITFADNCDNSPIITYSVDSIPVGCQYVIQRIWEAEDNCSNISRDTQNITVDVSLTASASVTSNYNTQGISCNGASDGEASVVVAGDHYPFNYSWSNSDADSILSSVSAGTYTVTVTNSIGCTTSTSITISEPTLIQVNPKADTTMCAGEPYELTAAASGGNGTYLYSWNNGLGSGQNQTVNPLVTTTYTVTVTDLNSCTVTDQITITIVSCPEDCTDGIDNDGDGLTDCDDPDCAPIANNATLNTCDNSNMTGSGTFFLHDANPTVSSESGVMISYHSTLLDAQNGANVLISPYTSNDATVYSRVERISTGCFSTSEITLDVGAKCPENCNNGKDDDGDGLIDCDDPDCPCCDAYAPILNGLNKKDP
ncbi:MAG: LamG-like jellyroll fold domain-containing protein [Saprospiraceae bacterium]